MRIANEKILDLWRNFPSIHTKLRYQESNFHATEILFSEEFLKQAGYSLDAFITTVFQEGIPQ